MEKPVLEIVRTYYSRLPPGYCHEPHCHHSHQLDVVLEGQREMTVRDDPPVCDKAGDAWLLPPLNRHGYTSRAGYRHMLFLFHLAPRFWTLLGSDAVKFQVPRRLLNEVDSAGSRFKKGAPLAKEQVSAVALLCLIQFLEQIAVQAPPPDNLDEFRERLWPLLERMDAEPYGGWTVGRMAEEIHLSPDYFSRCFQRVIGWTPHQYVFETRMRAVGAALLATPDRSMKEIAHRAGYDSVQSFSRAFRRSFNMAPGAYRSSQRNG